MTKTGKTKSVDFHMDSRDAPTSIPIKRKCPFQYLRKLVHIIFEVKSY